MTTPSFPKKIRDFLSHHFFLTTLFCCTVLSFIVYAKALTIGFLSDDWGYVYLSQHETFFHSLRFLFTPDIIGNHLGNYRPLQSILSVLTIAPLYNHPELLHAVSLLLHSIVAAMAGYLTYRLFGQKRAGLFAACVFAVFPLNTEAALWLASWNAPLALIPLLGALIIYTTPPQTKKIMYIAALAIISLLSKEYALLLPFLLFGIDLLLQRKISYRSIAAFFILDAVYLLWRIHVLGGLGGYYEGGKSISANISLYHIVQYTTLIFGYTYGFFNRHTAPFFLGCIARIITFLTIIGIFISQYKRKNTIFIIKTVSILIFLLYASNIIGWNLVNPLDANNQHSRILYLSSVWFAILMGYLFSITKQRILQGSFMAYLVLLCFIAYFEAQPWIQAGTSAAAINTQVQQVLAEKPRPTKIRITNLPDEYYGAFVYRNGIDFSVAVFSHTQRNTITVEKTMQPGIDLPIIIEHDF